MREKHMSVKEILHNFTKNILIGRYSYNKNIILQLDQLLYYRGKFQV
jgi:hypothetical protein